MPPLTGVALDWECCPAISSPPIGKTRELSEQVLELIQELDSLVWADVEHNGYAVLQLTPEAARVEYVHSAPVEARSPFPVGGAVFEAAAGTHRVVRVDGGRGERRG